SYECDCNGYYGGEECAFYLPKRHCADLYVYHHNTTNGAYIIKPPYPYSDKQAFTELTVYCDMTTSGGGWTLMTNSLSNSMSNKTFKDYVDGFGNPSIMDVWIGLDVLHGMTNEVETRSVSFGFSYYQSNDFIFTFAAPVLTRFRHISHAYNNLPFVIKPELIKRSVGIITELFSRLYSS
uniref:Fibrinogen C-terminal domain-containing protein n=1 Tax=Ascaris lumbricoides TaxID=6252 RepID=A0A0M3HYX9_ASCLU